MVKKPFFEITVTNLQLRRMRELNSAVGLDERQTEITAKRVDFYSRVHTDADKRADLTRIIELAEVPALVPGETFDAGELIDLRESDEARAFRDFIQQGGGLDEDQIKEILQSWRKKIGEKARTSKVKNLRWLASTGVGAVLEPVSGTAIGIIDQFIDKLLGDMGPIGFINTEYRRFIKEQIDDD